MKKMVVVNSFHSQVPYTLIKELKRFDEEPDVLVSLDSHIDDHLSTTSTAPMPKNIRLAADRANAHTMIRRVIGELPIILKSEGREDEIELMAKMFLVIPQDMVNSHVMTFLNMMAHHPEKEKFLKPSFNKEKESFLKYALEVNGFSIISSPPQNIFKLVDVLRTNCPILDIDVDYMHELQQECYTPIINAKPGDLGWMHQVLKLIKKTKPSLITMSEAKVSAIKNPDSNFSKFIQKLKSMNYTIQFDDVFSSDDEAETAMNSYQEFFNDVQTPIMKRSIEYGDFDSHEEISDAIKHYFEE